MMSDCYYWLLILLADDADDVADCRFWLSQIMNVMNPVFRLDALA